ncbi:MAG: BrnT family toxin [Caulobacteraceae bacterium]|nr:BrnT family toxin [Caulobacteraceae bacterium]
MGMDFEWDPAKARSNLVKHGIAFDEAIQVWDDPLHQSRRTRIENFEERWQTIGMVGPVALVLVVHTYPDPQNDQRVRVMSARRALRHERRQYEEAFDG